VLWALHQTDPELNTALWHGERRGGRALRIRTAAAHSPPQETRNVQHWDLKLNQVRSRSMTRHTFPSHVPTNRAAQQVLVSQYNITGDRDTIYWCKLFQAPPLKGKHHMIGVSAMQMLANRFRGANPDVVMECKRLGLIRMCHTNHGHSCRTSRDIRIKKRSGMMSLRALDVRGLSMRSRGRKNRDCLPRISPFKLVNLRV